MSAKHLLSRRRFLQIAGIGAAGALCAACGARLDPVVSAASAVAAPTPTAGGMMDMTGSQAASADFNPDLEINLRAVTGEVGIYQGAKTRIWHYEGEVVKGDKSALQPVPGSYLGPVLLLKRGQKVRVNFTNQLPEVSIVHWHGLHVPSIADGLPEQSVPTGGQYVYEFTVDNRAGTAWFHPHPHMRTGYQAYMGLAGLILVSDDEEAGLGLPSGEYDVPLVIQDRIIDNQNQFYYPTSMMNFMQGVLGDRILVNGQAQASLPAAATAYRLRLLNGSNARTYKLAWEDGAPWSVIATDGGLLEKPVQRPYITLAPGERIEAWVDFSGRKVGSQVKLISQAFAGGTMQMMGGMMGSSLANGAQFPVLAVKIDRQGPPAAALPAVLSTFQRLSEAGAVNAASPRTFTLSMMRMNWLMNGRTYVMDEVASDEIVKLDTTEAWVFNNAGTTLAPAPWAGVSMGGMGGGMRGGGMMGGGMGGMMNMPHVMHLHTVEFLIIERKVDPLSQADWMTVSDGLVDEGWKDTFLIMPGEQVKFLVRFSDFTGMFMYHCHIIEHEDMGMMRYFRVDK